MRSRHLLVSFSGIGAFQHVKEWARHGGASLVACSGGLREGPEAGGGHKLWNDGGGWEQKAVQADSPWAELRHRGDNLWVTGRTWRP